MRFTYWHNFLISAHEVIDMWHLKGIFVAGTYKVIAC